MFSYDAPRRGLTRLAGFIKRITIHCYTEIGKALGLVVSEKTVFFYFPIVSLWDFARPYIAKQRAIRVS